MLFPPPMQDFLLQAHLRPNVYRELHQKLHFLWQACRWDQARPIELSSINSHTLTKNNNILPEYLSRIYSRLPQQERRKSLRSQFASEDCRILFPQVPNSHWGILQGKMIDTFKRYLTLSSSMRIFNYSQICSYSYLRGIFRIKSICCFQKFDAKIFSLARMLV